MGRIRKTTILALVIGWGSAGRAPAQAPGVEIVRDRGEPFAMLVSKANALRENNELLSMAEVTSQLVRTHCTLTLPPPATRPLSDRDIWRRSRAAHVRVGWHYRCQKCDHWHQHLAGGYFISTNGLVATCFHVVEPGAHYREGFLVAATAEGEILPVTEVLAGNALDDVAILQARVRAPVTALALNAQVYPGDPAWCYSDPLGRNGYFSKGMVNRFYWFKKAEHDVVRIDLSTDWAQGSSGAAILDACGNAIGHVAEVNALGAMHKDTNATVQTTGTVIVFHSAAPAAAVLALSTPAPPPTPNR